MSYDGLAWVVLSSILNLDTLIFKIFLFTLYKIYKRNICAKQKAVRNIV